MIFRDTAFLRVVSRFGGLQIIYVIHVAQRLLLHFDWIYYGLGDDLLLLLRLGLDIETFSLRKVEDLISLGWWLTHRSWCIQMNCVILLLFLMDARLPKASVLLLRRNSVWGYGLNPTLRNQIIHTKSVRLCLLTDTWILIGLVQACIPHQSISDRSM